MALVPLLLLPIAIAVCPVGMTAGPPDESELKAVLLIGFARFIERTDATETSVCTAGDAAPIRDIAPDLSEIRVLTLGGGPGLLDSSGTLEFIRPGNKIQFIVNSKLLTLARSLKNSGAE